MPRLSCLILLVLVGCSRQPAVEAPTHDLIVRGGTILDGSGSEGYVGDVVVDGDTARLVDRLDPKSETNITLVREDGVWKVTSSGLVAQFGEEVATQRIEMLKHRAEIVSGVAAEVAADKYDSIDAVGNGLRDALRR